MVDSAASVDGSAMAGMNVDCAQCDNRLTYIPPRDYRGVLNATRPVFENAGSYPRMIRTGASSLYAPENNLGFAEFVPIGYVSQPPIKTLGYWESTMPLMNEAGVSFGESSCGTKLVGTQDSLLDVTELLRLAAERCSTARCAVETMGSLSQEYGFLAMKNEVSPGTQGDGTIAYDDAGEAFVIADEKGEAWVMHLTGGFPGISRSTWVAQRVPKGHVSVLANSFTIRQIPLVPSEEIIFHPKIRQTARAANLWSGSDSDEFDFTKIFGIDLISFQRKNSDLPIPLYTSLRTWRVFDLLAPSLRLEVTLDNRVYPFSVKPEKLVSHRDMFRIFGDYYADSEFDLTEGILAGPFGTPYRHEGGSSEAIGQIPRAISIPRTSYSVLGQSVKGGNSVAWFAIDQPMTGVYVPLLAQVRSEEGIDESYQVGNLLKFERNSAFWAFDFVSNYMALNWLNMSIEEVFPLQNFLQDHIDAQLSQLSLNCDLNEWQRGVQTHVVNLWWDLADRLVVKYNDGYYTRVDVEDPIKSVVGKSYGLPDWYNRMVGLTADVHPVWVQPWHGEFTDIKSEIIDRNSLPKDIFRSGYRHNVPKIFDFQKKVWVSESPSAGITPERIDISTGPLITSLMSSLILGIGIGYFISNCRLIHTRHIKAEPLLG